MSAATPPQLTTEQAKEMTDALLVEYGRGDFQAALHSIWAADADPAKRFARRAALCLGIQKPIISRYGFEASRKGVTQSVAAFSRPPLAQDPQLQEATYRLGVLVDPDKQQAVAAGGCSLATATAAAAGVAAAAAATARAEGAVQAKPSLATRPRAAKAPQAQDPEEAFLRRWRLGPPEWFRPAPEPGGAAPSAASALTRETALAMLGELVAGFSAGEFQQKLRKTMRTAGDNTQRVVRARQEVCMEVQLPIVSKYGFERSFAGVLRSTQAFNDEWAHEAEVRQMIAICFWLIDPVSQASLPIPTGPAQVPLRTTIRVRVPADTRRCEVAVDLAGTVRGLKERIQLELGIPWQAQRLFGHRVGEGLSDWVAASPWLRNFGPAAKFSTAIAKDEELDDWVPLHRLSTVGGSADLELVHRRPDVTDWLIKIRTRDAVDLLARAPPELLADPEFMVPAVMQHTRCLEFAPAAYRASRTLLLTVVQYAGQALQFAAPTLQADREVVLAAVRHDGWALQHAAPPLQADREIVFAAVLQDGWALQFASPERRNDRDIVLVAASKDAWVIANTAPELQCDREIALAAVKQDWRVLEALPEEVQADREVVLAAVRADGWALGFASPALRGDRAVVLEAVRRTGEALRFASKELCADREAVIAAVRACGAILAAVPPEVQDLEMVLVAIKSDPRAVSFVPSRLQEAVKERLGWQHVPQWGRPVPGELPCAGSPGVPRPGDVQLRGFPHLRRFYDVLGVPESASPEKIKKEYRRLALKHHPDKHPHDPETAKQIFQSISMAYQQIREALRI